jgi:hypothetical protein
VKDIATLTVSAASQKLQIGAWKYVKLVVGSVDVQVSLVNSPVEKETGDYATFKANSEYFIALEAGFYWLFAKTATGTSTLSVAGSNEQILWKV